MLVQVLQLDVTANSQEAQEHLVSHAHADVNERQKHQMQRESAREKHYETALEIKKSAHVRGYFWTCGATSTYALETEEPKYPCDGQVD